METEQQSFALEKRSLKRTINFWWVISVLGVLLIISIATFIVSYFCGAEYCKILEVLDIVSTMLAITLSIFSILYSYNTSQDASNALSSVAGEVVKIENTYTHLESHMSTILNSIKKGDGEADSKVKNIKSNIPNAADQVTNKK